MWFDARAKLAEIVGLPPTASATTATHAPAAPPVSQMSQLSQRPEARKPPLHVASVAKPLRAKSQPMPPARADGLDPDAGAYLDRLRLHGPATYGAMASAMGWGATRAWRAEATLRAAGLVEYREGRAVSVVANCDNVTL